MNFRAIFFDLDATLYPADNLLWAEIGRRIEIYLQNRMGLSPAESIALKRSYYEQYGTTLRGLQHHHHIDPQDYLQFVHDIPLKNYLQPDPPLREMIQSLSARKWIFTNSDLAHSQRVLTALGLDGCFDGVISLESLDYECKPQPIAYQTALELAGEPDPGRVVYLDDSIRNLAPATALGLCTVLVGPALPSGNGALPGGIAYSIPRPHDLPHVLPELFVRQ